MLRARNSKEMQQVGKKLLVLVQLFDLQYNIHVNISIAGVKLVK